MADVRSAIAIYDSTTGELVVLAPVGTPLRTGQASVDLPSDFSEEVHVWNATRRAYEASLPKLKAGKWAAIKAARDHAEWGGCLTLLGRVDTDPDSQRKVSGSVQMAMIAQAAGAPFEIPWTMQGNETVQHDAMAMIQMGVAVGQHVAACHGEALMRRLALEPAEDEAAIDAIPVEGGWPGA